MLSLNAYMECTENLHENIKAEKQLRGRNSYLMLNWGQKETIKGTQPSYPLLKDIVGIKRQKPLIMELISDIESLSWLGLIKSGRKTQVNYMSHECTYGITWNRYRYETYGSKTRRKEGKFTGFVCLISELTR